MTTAQFAVTFHILIMECGRLFNKSVHFMLTLRLHLMQCTQKYISECSLLLSEKALISDINELDRDQIVPFSYIIQGNQMVLFSYIIQWNHMVPFSYIIRGIIGAFLS